MQLGSEELELLSLRLHLGGYYTIIFLPDFRQPLFQNQRMMPKITVSLKAELTPCAQAFPWKSRVPSLGRTVALLSHPPHSSPCSCCHSLGKLWAGTGSLDQADPKAPCYPRDRQVPTLPPVPPCCWSPPAWRGDRTLPTFGHH